MGSKAKKPSDSADISFPVVGIGASAGGFKALDAFLSEMPEDFAFAMVFIQHLSPKHESLLPDLLRSRRPELDIDEISDGLEILPGRLYVCPPGKEVVIENSVFHVASRPEGHIHLPIDEFFVSLAESVAERAIAVILSGAGTDGTRGIQAVRRAGGCVFVQDPGTAEFTGMPLAAIDTEQMDAVLSPKDIAGEILRLHSLGIASYPPDSLVSAAQLEPFYRIVHEKTGYRFNHYKKSVLARRIRRRMYLHGISSAGDYLEMLTRKDSEVAALAFDLMIGVTSFFRDKVSWKALHLEVTRKLVLEEEASPIRVWTPACATGEEAYSITMMLQHELDNALRKREIQVFATDVNDRALEKAREGTYPASIASDIPPDYIGKFFTYSDDALSLTIDKEIRQRVVFAKQDLLTDPPFSRLDLVICRNLLIYLEPDAQEKCISLFHYALKPGGYLFLGNAESPGKANTLFATLAHKKCRVYRKLEAKQSVRIPFTVPFAAERTALPPARRVIGADNRQSLTEFIHESLIEEYAPAAVAITQTFEIVYHNGPTRRYLSQPRGTPTHNLLELLPKNLQSRVRGGLYRAAQEMKPVSLRTSLPDESGRKRHIAIRISKLRENLFLVAFKEKGSLPEEAEAGFLEASAVEETATRQLESELSATRETLQNHIEQLRSLNEELQSSNEELQAANEELETSREELQSLNEELITVNSQFQTKIEEQEETNNDLNNFLASTNIPTVFLDYRFRVKRFTPAMSKLIKLIPSDAGRPIIDMSQENLGPDLIADARSVLEQLVPVKREFAIDGNWYVRTTLPYRTADNRIEGVVVTYTDVTGLKRAEERTRHLASFPELNPNPVVEVDSSGRITFSNPAVQKTLEDLGMGKEDARVFLPEDMDGALRDWDHKTQLLFHREITIMGRVFGLTVSLVPHFNVARIYAFEITKRKRAEEALKATVERLDIISSTAGQLLASPEPQKIVDSLCRRVMEHLGCDAFFNFLVDEERNCLRLNAYAGVPEETAREIRFLDFGVAVCGCAARDACRVVAENIPTTPDIRTDLVRSFGIKAYACHPLVARGKVIGTLSFGTKSRFTFTDEELSLMKTVADQVATAMERVRLLHAVKERADELDVRVQERTAELKVASAYNRRLIEASPDPLVTIDPDGRISDVNAATEQVTGCSRTELIGTDFSDYFTDPQKARAGYRRVFEEGFVHDYPLEICHRDGHTTPVLYNASVYRDEAGQVIGVFATARDVSRLRQAENQLRQAQKMDALGTLTGGIAHDFNNILAAIIGFTEIVHNHVQPGTRDEHHLDRIMEASLRGRELIKQMLTFSRKTEQEKRPLLLSSVVKETMKLLRASIPTTIAVETRIRSESGMVLADPTQIQQVLMNLATNGAQAMQEKGGILEVELSDFSVSPSNREPDGIRPGLYMRLTVRDTGRGIPDDIIDKIFDPFFTTKGLGEGTGLGLSVVLGIIEQSDGYITVESEPGRGSLFTVYLPKVVQESSLDDLHRDETIPTGHERILFVDDEEAIVEMGEAILTQLGYDVTSRVNSREALSLLKEDPSGFDLVISDMTMPELAGIDLAREILALRADMPIIMCTGFSHLVDADKAKAAGIRAFAMKPLTKREIARTIRQVLDR